MATDATKELIDFIEGWEDTPERNKEAFLHLKDHLEKKEGVFFEFIPRPGVTYSLRAVHAAHKDRGLFAMIDVIEDTPRWLSVCFYDDMITDPEERGDFVPEGLLGEDAACFDIDEHDEDVLAYVEARLDEACKSASENALV
jgi:hypothetical protein